MIYSQDDRNLPFDKRFPILDLEKPTGTFPNWHIPEMAHPQTEHRLGLKSSNCR